MTSIVIFLLYPDRTKFERELVAELKERHSRGVSGLIIRDGTIVSRLPRPANKLI